MRAVINAIANVYIPFISFKAKQIYNWHIFLDKHDLISLVNKRNKFNKIELFTVATGTDDLTSVPRGRKTGNLDV